MIRMKNTPNMLNCVWLAYVTYGIRYICASFASNDVNKNDIDTTKQNINLNGDMIISIRSATSKDIIIDGSMIDIFEHTLIDYIQNEQLNENEVKFIENILTLAQGSMYNYDDNNNKNKLDREKRAILYQYLYDLRR